MLDPPARASSSATESFEEALVARDDARDRLRVRGRVPDAAFERPPEDNPVGPREHVAEVAERGVADLGLRLEDRKLAADGLELDI